jgi:BASS family bile acid:Na+ symporter
VKDLLLLVLLPLALGLIAKACYPENTKDWQPELVKVSNLALVIALATGIADSWHTIVTMFGSWIIVTAVVIVIVGLATGALAVPILTSGGRSASVAARRQFMRCQPSSAPAMRG